MTTPSKTVSQLVAEIQSKLTLVANGHPSQYINWAFEDDDNYEVVKIRVSNHSAKKRNNSGQTLSFITDTCNQGYYGMSFNEYVVESIEEMHTNETNYKGWLTVESILEDFVEDFKFTS